jgi:hypothetical protein
MNNDLDVDLHDQYIAIAALRTGVPGNISDSQLVMQGIQKVLPLHIEGSKVAIVFCVCHFTGFAHNVASGVVTRQKQAAMSFSSSCDTMHMNGQKMHSSHWAMTWTCSWAPSNHTNWGGRATARGTPSGNLRRCTSAQALTQKHG